MTNIESRKSIQDVAEVLAHANREAEPNIIRTYLFPSDLEIRLIYVDETAFPLASDDEIAPFYFAPDLSQGIDYPAGIALIRPEDQHNHTPPSAWGDWTNAKVIWERP